MNIQEIKDRVDATGSYFFNRDTLKFFSQTMKSFSVSSAGEGRWLIEAPIIDKDGNPVMKEMPGRPGCVTGMKTRRIFVEASNKLENVKKED